jgi:hypothetical protein
MPTFRYDLPLDDDHPPQRGDVVETARTVYLVTDVRPVDSPQWANRWRVACRRIGHIAVDGIRHYDAGSLPAAVPEYRTARWHTFRRYEKGETPQQFFATFADS